MPKGDQYADRDTCNFNFKCNRKYWNNMKQRIPDKYSRINDFLEEVVRQLGEGIIRIKEE